MRESVLAEFLSGKVIAGELRLELADVVGTNTLQVGENMILDLSSDLEIGRDHLIRLCEAFLKGDLDSDQLEAIAFFLIGSDHFMWNSDFKEGELVAEILFDWSAPEINYELTKENVSQYLAGLQEWRYPFPAKPKPGSLTSR